MNKNFCINQLIIARFDHKHSSVEVREKVAFIEYNTNDAYKKLLEENIVKEAIILSTCNRSEIYAVVCNEQEGKEYLTNFYSKFFNANINEITEHILFNVGRSAVKHLFEVACGYQSMILAEDQILGQVKKAYESAVTNNASGKILNRLFIESITSAKKIKALTGASGNSISMSSIGIKLIEEKLGTLPDKTALVIGLGEMSELTVQNMLAKNIGKIYVTNRTSRKTANFTEKYPGIIGIEFKDRYSVINDVDIIISSTSAPHFIVHANKFKQYYKAKPLCILDLAIPRDIEPDIADIENVTLYRVDDLERISQENIEKIKLAKAKGLKVIDEEIERYISWLNETRVANTIVEIQQAYKTIVLKEVKDLRNKLGSIDEKQMILIEKALNHIAKSVIHQPILKLKELTRENLLNNPDSLDEYGSRD